MKVKLNLFILIFVVILLTPTSVFALSQGNCSKYDSKYYWKGYTIIRNGVEEPIDIKEIANVKENTIPDYFNTRFKSGEINIDGITGIMLIFEDNQGNVYDSKADVGIIAAWDWPPYEHVIKCDGSPKKIAGVTVVPQTQTDQEVADMIASYHCSDLKSTELYTKVLNPAYKFVRISVPALMVLLCSYDFMSAVVANDQDKMKKAQSRVAKRIFVGIIIFLLPNLINALLNLLGDYGTCGIGM